MTARTLNRPLPVARRIAAAILAGFVVAVVTHVTVVLVFFSVNGATAANIPAISDYFTETSLVLLVLVAVAALLGLLRRWAIAAVVGLVASILAALVGTTLGVLQSGAAWTPDAFVFIASSLIATNLLYLVVATVATATVGVCVWFAVASLPGRAKALVRMPSARLAEGQVTHIDRVAVDEELADTQWEAYVAALEAEGFETVEVGLSEDHPDSVFVEDAIVVFGGTAVITSPGAESRRGETDALRPLARKLGYTVREIEQPGTLDGGDVLKVGTTVYVGRGGRTNAEGIAQLRAIVAPLGYTVVAVPVTKVLHLKSAVTALPDGTVVGFAKQVDNPAVFDHFLALPEPGAAVVVLSEDSVLMAASVPKSVALIESLGYRVVTVDVSEFEKLEGCVTCLSVRLR
ncbi:MAG: dimethylarginine dimethylaminohydrolase [Rhodoglobus sp.]|nr:dimethylarginine dimethylaminohydrolase [Rhodoglobus sp.]